MGAISFVKECTFGIDIERINDQKITALSYISLEKEPVEQNPEQLTIAWCMKESLSKALLCGFSQSFEDFLIKSFQLIKNDNAERCYHAEFEHYPQYESIAKIIDLRTNVIIAATHTN